MGISNSFFWIILFNLNSMYKKKTKLEQTQHEIGFSLKIPHVVALECVHLDNDNSSKEYYCVNKFSNDK